MENFELDDAMRAEIAASRNTGRMYWKKWFYEDMLDAEYTKGFCRALFEDDREYADKMIKFISAMSRGIKPAHPELATEVGNYFDIGVPVPDDPLFYKKLFALYTEYKEDGLEGAAGYQHILWELYEWLWTYNDMFDLDGCTYEEWSEVMGSNQQTADYNAYLLELAVQKEITIDELLNIYNY